MASRRLVAASRTASRTTKVSPSTDQLADQLASALKLSDDTPEQTRLVAMRAINAASQALSTAAQSGWKKSSGKPSPPTVKSSAAAAAKHLTLLRTISPDDIDVERAAMSVLGKLVAMEMYDDALSALDGLRRRLCALSNAPTLPQTLLREGHLLSLPILPDSADNNITLLTLISMYLMYSITIFFHTSFNGRSAKDNSSAIEALATALDDSQPTLLVWAPALSSLPSKHLDSIFTRTYTTITKACSSFKSNQSALFSMRIYAAGCLAYTTTGTMESDAFWDQVVKFGNALVLSQISEEEVMRVIIPAYSGITTRIESAKDKNKLMLGKGYLRFCEFWMAFAKKAGDICLVDRIVGLLNAPSSSKHETSDFVIKSSANTEQISTSKSDHGNTLEAARLCAVFVQMTTVLEQNTSDIVTRSQETVRHLRNRSLICALIQRRDGESEEDSRIGTKVDRTLEKLRRTATTFLEASHVSSQSDNHRTVHSMVNAVLHVLLPLADSRPDPAILPRILETLFVLAKSGLNPRDPQTYIPAHEYLVKAASIVEALSLSDPSLDTPNYVRCVSGAFYNLAATMYQAGRYGSAVGMMKEACRLGAKALELRGSRDQGSEHEGIEKEGKRAEEGWKQLEEQLYKRWELLGVCHSKIGERKPALHAFTESIRAFSYSTSGLAARTESVCPEALFDHSSGSRHLGTLIERVTHLSVFELLMEPSSVSLASLCNLEPAVLGALLERQIRSLGKHRLQDGASSVVVRLLKDALDVYSADKMPIRRARVLLKCLEFTYHINQEQVHLGRPEDLGKEAIALSQCLDLGNDTQLAAIGLQYQASAHLWLALHAHREGDSDQFSLISHHIEQACKIAKELVAGRAEDKKTPRKSPTKPVVVTKKTTFPPPTARQRGTKKPAAKDPHTPKPKTRKAPHPATANTATPPRSTTELGNLSLVFDDFDGFVALFQFAARIAGLFGLSTSKIRILGTVRRLCELQRGVQSDGYILASVDLASEYAFLGRSRRAGSVYNQVLSIIDNGKVSDEACAVFFLRFAESLASSENVSESSIIYGKALALAEKLDFEDKALPTFERINVRVRRIERAAMASYVVALINHLNGDITASIGSMLQSIRLWNRAVDSLARLYPQPSSQSSDDQNPFEEPEDRSSLEPSSGRIKELAPSRRTYLPKSGMDDMGWRISEGLLTTLFSLSQVYLNRGSAREAEYFAQQAQDFAESLNVPVMVSRALAKKAEIQLRVHRLDDCLESLTRAAELVQRSEGVGCVEIQHLRGIYSERIAAGMDANQIYDETLHMLEELDQTFKQVDDVLIGRKSIGSSPNHKPSKEMILPEMFSSVLRRQIWLLRDNAEDYTNLLNTFLSLPRSSQTKAGENSLMAKLTLHAAYERLRGDMFLSALADSTMALPRGMSGPHEPKPSAPVQNVLETLDTSESLFWRNLNLIAARGNVVDVREAIVSLAVIQAFQTSLGKPGVCAPALVAGLLDASNAITLRREMLEVIQNKFPPSIQEDIQWPVLTDDRFTAVGSSSRAFDLHDDLLDESSIRRYWDVIRTKYQSQEFEPAALSLTPTADLPHNWTVIHINITDDQSTLFLTRQYGGNGRQTPLIFSVPLKGRRDESREHDHDHLTFGHATDELNEIIRLSDQGTKAAIHVKSDDPEARAAWWKERADLDKRLRELLENIEFCWFGGFKTILSPRPRLTPELLSGLHKQFKAVFLRSLHVQDKKTKPRPGGNKKNGSRTPNPSLSQVSFDDNLLECFATLSPKCKDEELEDLVFFVLDLYQFYGVPVAIAEVDITQVVVDLRIVLEDFSQKLSRNKTSSPDPDEHIFLVLDKSLQSIPWESMPILRGRSISRIPSVDFLRDRVLFAEWKSKTRENDAEACAKGAVVNPRRGYFILNPSGDLRRTESRFKAWTNEMREVGWTGIVGHPPSEQQLLNALREQDLVVYFGHGGGEQYVRSHKLRSLPTCAATMLWGCSSGTLKDMGDFDRIGTPYHYMLAGCPTLVANLWDVTDKDIDKFSQSVFEKLHLSSSGVKRWPERRRDGGVSSVVTAVATSRDSCKLKYLTGAAPVVYGIPFYL